MKLDQHIMQYSTFKTAQADLFKIVDKLMTNEDLKKLLYYSTSDALERENLTDAESIQLIGNNIRVVPKLQLDDEVETYVIITFDNFITNQNNPQYRDNTISFDILSHFDNWSLKDYELRPYKIMGEIDGMLNNKSLNGIGKIDFVNASQLILSNDLGGYSLLYRVINDV